MLEHALRYASQGFYVFPLHAPQGAVCTCGLPLGNEKGQCPAKHPRVHAWQTEATRNVEQITTWWTGWPDAGIGIATGKSGFFVVDLDVSAGKRGPDEWGELCEKYGDEGDPQVITTGSGGTHLLYRYAEGVTNSKGGLQARAIDIRGAGGYIVAPPSLHWTGRRYEGNIDGRKLTDAPQWLLQLLKRTHLPDAPPVKLEGAHELTRADLNALIEKKKRFADAAALVETARAVLDGRPWAPHGSRHTAMVSLLGALRTFVLDTHGAPVDPESMCVVFRDSLDAVAALPETQLPPDRNWLLDLHAKLAGSDESYRGKLEAARERRRLPDGSKLELPVEGPSEHPAAVREAHISRAFAGARTEAYTSDELQAMMPIDNRWLLGTIAGYFLRGPHGYIGPFPRELVVNKARDVLAPAITSGVETHETVDGKTRPLTLVELLDRYGQVPTSVRYSYFIPRSELVGEAFVQRTAAADSFEPEYNAQIAQWLVHFGGEHHEALLDWLSTLHDLEKPTCAVSILGFSGAGKDLFIDGVSACWGRQKTAFDRAIGQFNSSLLVSPIVVANESLKAPNRYAGNVVDALKEMVSDTLRQVEAKYANAVQLEGAMRVILATNQSGSFKLDRQPTESDLVALHDRVLLVRPTTAARLFLESLGGREHTEAWVAGGGIPRHIEWLRRNRKVAYGSRFIVQGRGGLAELLAAEGKGSGPVLRAILQALCTKLLGDERVVCVRDGEVWVSQSNLKGLWATFGGKDEIPDDLGDVFKTITEAGSGKPVRASGELVKMRQVKLAVLRQAASKEGLEDELEEKILGRSLAAE
jgi:hypothetical protein